MAGYRSLTIVIGDEAPRLVQFAARELQGYVHRLAGFLPEVASAEIFMEAPTRVDTPVILVGSPANNPLIQQTVAGTWPELSDQGFLLRTATVAGTAAVIVGADSPVATLWAAYDLVEHWGVTFTPRCDIFPHTPIDLALPEVDKVAEPALRVRGWRGLNCEVNGPEFWGLEDYRQLIGQLAKLRYNVFFVSIYPYGPWVDYEFHGVRKSTSELFFGMRYPLHDGMIGRELFGDADEFTNPEFLGLTGYDERLEAGKRLINGIMDEARRVGMKTGLRFVSPIETVNEFRFPFKDWTDVPDDPARDVDPQAALFRLGTVLFGTDPGNTKHQNVEDPLVQEFGAAVMKAHLDTYPDMDYYIIWQSEFRASATDFRRCWAHLDEKYDLSSVADLDTLIAEASKATVSDFVGGEDGAKGPLRQLKGDIEYLYLLDRLTNEMRVQDESLNPQAMIYYGAFRRELYGVLAKVLAETGHGYAGCPGLTADPEAVQPFSAFGERGVPALLKWTPQTDFAMMLQVRLTLLQKAVQELRDGGAEGYKLCFWVLGDFVPTACYVARLSWDPSVTPEQFLQEFLVRIVGPEAITSAFEGFQAIDAATAYGEWEINCGFPTSQAFKVHFDQGLPDPRMDRKRELYEEAIILLRRAHQLSRPGGRKFLEYFIGRAEYTVRLIRSLSMLEHAGQTYKTLEDAKKRRDGQEQYTIYERVLGMLDEALETIEDGARALAGVAEDQSDRGNLAATNVYGIDYIRYLRHIIWLDSTHG